MANADTFLSEQNLTRILAYGPPNTRKTWWAATAAEAGFNVLLLAGDKNYGTLRLLTPEARKRIFILDWSDTPAAATYAKNLTDVLSVQQPLFYNEQTKQKIFTPVVGDIKFDKTLLNSNWVFILDTYTALAWSYLQQYCIENNETMVEVQKPGSKGMRESYRYCGVLASWALQELKKLQCHLIVVAHQDSYEKRDKNDKVILSRIQVKSTSGPHAMQIAKDFTDVFTFNIMGQSVNIDTTAKPNQDGGSTLIPPGIYQWDALTFKTVIETAGMTLPPADLPYPEQTLLVTQADIDAVGQRGANLLQGFSQPAAATLAVAPAGTVHAPTGVVMQSPVDLLGANKK